MGRVGGGEGRGTGEGNSGVSEKLKVSVPVCRCSEGSCMLTPHVGVMALHPPSLCADVYIRTYVRTFGCGAAYRRGYSPS